MRVCVGGVVNLSKYCQINQQCVLTFFLHLVQFNPPNNLINFVSPVTVEFMDVNCILLIDFKIPYQMQLWSDYVTRSAQIWRQMNTKLHESHLTILFFATIFVLSLARSWQQWSKTFPLYWCDGKYYLTGQGCYNLRLRSIPVSHGHFWLQSRQGRIGFLDQDWLHFMSSHKGVNCDS